MPRRTISYRKLKAIEERDFAKLGRLSALEDLGRRSFPDSTAEIPGTGPEKLVYDYLKRLGVRFQFQYHQEDFESTSFPEDIYRPDFRLPDFNSVIEVYGEYWHSLPRRRESDLKKQARQLYAGYVVIEGGIPTWPESGAAIGKYVIWWGHEIMTNLPYLFARDLPELLSLTAPKGLPDEYIRDIEADWQAQKRLRAQIIEARLRPRVHPIERKLRSLHRRLFDINKIYPFLHEREEFIRHRLPRELRRKGYRK